MLKTFLTRFIKDERGVTAIEYGIIGVALAVAIGAAIGTGSADGGLTGAIKAAFETISGSMGTSG
ncbi:hypothetical protein BCV02_09000 [Vibrio breoganii]|uniref:Flp family type IVb pilin n=1 Tax=Vibrio breoganii TaxID=553239 RepID=A0ABX1U721_9VIBR|nr:Flp family type IVb pilin [Vibrio breoganii]NMO72669.1 Flp family type IVb pilin [Vibrio breoganii]NMR69066.1 Flp family type IVb pilin [Vibrio breoganii]OED97875.1 hypothetical protein A1QG_09945 [Vibrio breoganii ZF-29]PMG03239.1 hypothetical protein BCV02_09000 [Vibrio breoganii]PML90555.1 hypothetical protein BCT67_05785 [Vibrio breoganii]